ncbi:MAG: bifunctional aspartate kinase/homoserine dehydrogenase I [Spirochaetales bacterium]|nr:bifunctional aspartate kinase/homoserine dehydrogenase I [Spirochaetales bacterium]
MNSYNVHAFQGSLCQEKGNLEKLPSILKSESTHFLVLSPSRTQNGLSSLLENAVQRDDKLWSRMESLSANFRSMVDENLSGAFAAELTKKISQGFRDLEDVLRAVWLVKDAGASSWAYIDRMQNDWICSLTASLLEQKGYKVSKKDAADFFVLKKGSSGYMVDMEKTRERLETVFSPEDYDGSRQVILISGGYGRDADDQVVYPGSYGGELTATSLANIFKAQSVTFWNPEELVMTADPNEVPSAQVIPELTYAEATELSHFGARVLHPQVMIPAISASIPLFLRDFANPELEGTKVSSEVSKKEGFPVKGFSVIHNMALLNIEGAGMVGIPGISSRLFTALRERQISVTFISQASSEHSICYAVPEEQAHLAASISRTVFHEELASYQIHSVELESSCAVLAAVGEQMPGTPGIAAAFFGALGKAGINILAIAQGSSERNISAVIKGSDSKRALRALHAGFFLSTQTISIGIFGPGLIGSTLLEQIRRETERLKTDFGVDLRIRGISNSKSMFLDKNGIDMEHWEELLQKEGENVDVDKFVNTIAADYFPHWVLIDCTTSEELPRRYVEWMNRGIHVITPNKKAGTEPYPYYQKLMESGRRERKHFLYETTVGAGLPIIGTLKDLIQTGDRIQKIEGVFSGTLAYLFWRYDGSVPFSQLVQEAKELGYTEPDPRDDLSGMDIVRKTVILAREMGLKVEVEDVPVRSLVPEALQQKSIEEFLQQLNTIDDDMLALFKEAEEQNKSLKYVGIIDSDGSCKVELRAYPQDHPFARITGTDNIVAFTTKRYHDQPLVVQGPGAGPEVTAGGVFGDLLRLAAYLGARF